ncbi:hypothetical protein M440DRAFT_1218702 [Trichoderma longibrachiatum ATCC 18648]|uniref:Uncharacterized protein n=1 Tax=Trichoderma longibrachiatum ATCC 18648 TaxID=983965 RepID=A0A2T4C7W6_TRILO|nr:hypothetical protein M440DRAFT_1218702 [Trichoderma longibrachiatum ATCC 18648]
MGLLLDAARPSRRRRFCLDRRKEGARDQQLNSSEWRSLASFAMVGCVSGTAANMSSATTEDGMPWPRQFSPADAAAGAADGGGKGTGSVGEPHHGPTSCRLRRTTAEDSRGQQHVAHTVRKRKHRRPRPAAAASTYLSVDELPGQARPSQTIPHMQLQAHAPGASHLDTLPACYTNKQAVPAVRWRYEYACHRWSFKANMSERIATGPWKRGCWHQGRGDALRLAFRAIVGDWQKREQGAKRERARAWREERRGRVERRRREERKREP